MRSWVREPRVAGGKGMTHGRLFERHLEHFGLLDADGSPLAFTEWAPLAQDRAGWSKLVTKFLFAIGKPHVRQPRCDTRVTPEDRQRFMAQRAAEAAERRALYDAATAAAPP
jgi:hypothetical protein